MNHCVGNEYKKKIEPYGVLLVKCYCEKIRVQEYKNILRLLCKSYDIEYKCYNCISCMKKDNSSNRNDYLCVDCEISNIVFYDDIITLNKIVDMDDIINGKYTWIKNNKVNIHHNHHFMIQHYELDINEFVEYAQWLQYLQKNNRLDKECIHRLHYTDACESSCYICKYG